MRVVRGWWAHRSSVWAFVAALSWSPCVALGGQLDPPAGAIQPTGPISLNAADISLPFTIAQPGHYVFTSSFSGLIGNNGITIAASNVVLDLNGFELIGVPGSVHGIFVSGTRDNLEVRNGIVRDWGGNGADLSFGRNCRMHNMRAYNNTSIGLLVGLGSIIEACTSSENRNDGIFAGTGSVIRNCSAYLNVDDGVTSNPGVTLQNVNASINGNSGFRILGGSTIVACTAYQNQGNGFVTGESCTIVNCTAEFNDVDGFRIGFNSLLESSVAYDNRRDGIQAETNCIIRGNVASRNFSDGIFFDDRCYVVGNTVETNAIGQVGAGLKSLGDMCLVSDNLVVANVNGVDLAGRDNVVVRNVAIGNSFNYVIPSSDNDVGPLGDAATLTSPWGNVDRVP